MPTPVGVFIVIEGPNGVGKTTICEALTRAVASVGVAVRATAEPTQSSLGQAIRELERSMSPEALALACAADRCDHIAREIQPALASGSWVLCDRYVPSSLVLQRIDGLDVDWIWSLNSSAFVPDLTVYLDDDAQTIRQRLDHRGRRSRFEIQQSTTLELSYYRDAHDFLARKGWNQTIVDCRQRTPTEIAADIVSRLLQTNRP